MARSQEEIIDDIRAGGERREKFMQTWHNIVKMFVEDGEEDGAFEHLQLCFQAVQRSGDETAIEDFRVKVLPVIPNEVLERRMREGMMGALDNILAKIPPSNTVNRTKSHAERYQDFARLPEGGEQAFKTFIERGCEAIEEGGSEQLGQWIDMAFFQIPKEDQRLIVTILFNQIVDARGGPERFYKALFG